MQPLPAATPAASASQSKPKSEAQPQPQPQPPSNAPSDPNAGGLDYEAYDDADYNTGEYEGQGGQAGQPSVGSGSTGGAGQAGQPGTGAEPPIGEYSYDNYEDYETEPVVPPSEPNGGASGPRVPPAEALPATAAPPKTPGESKPRKPSAGEEQPVRGKEPHVGQVEEGSCRTVAALLCFTPYSGFALVCFRLVGARVRASCARLAGRPRSAPSKSPAFHLPGGAGSLLSHPALIVGLFGVAVILLLFAILLGIFIIYKIKRGHDEGIYYVDGDSKHLSDSANAPLTGVASVKSPLLPPGVYGASSSPTAGAAAAAAAKTNPYMTNNGFATNNMNAAALQPQLGGSATYSPVPQNREYFA